ncbi:MAG: hypothetical protein IPN83_06980 [Holophagales bacterium]|nr:hypothetical protein [Holophagales bacterium]
MSATPGTPPPLCTLDPARLKADGFTESGSKHFCETVEDYAERLHERATHLGDVDKAPKMTREITHEHVRASSHSIARSFGSPPRSGWLVAAQVGEYIATATAGVGGGHLDKQGGIIAFGLGVSVAVVLVVTRLMNGKAE